MCIGSIDNASPGNARERYNTGYGQVVNANSEHDI
jgi:hypothetical protein